MPEVAKIDPIDDLVQADEPDHSIDAPGIEELPPEQDRRRPQCYGAENRHGGRIKRQKISEIYRITVDPGQCGGRPGLRGLRIRVRDVLDLLAAGADRPEMLEDYPLLEEGDITAALEYSARQADHPVLRVA